MLSGEMPVSPEINPKYVEIIRKCLSSNKEERFTNCQEIIDFIEKPFEPNKETIPISQAENKSQKKTSKNMMYIAIAIIVFLGGTWLIFSNLKKKTKSEEYIEQAENFLQKNDYVNASKYYANALLINKKNKELQEKYKEISIKAKYIQRADSLFEVKNIARAKLYYDSAIQKTPELKYLSENRNQCEIILKKKANLRPVRNVKGQVGFINGNNQIVIDYIYTEAKPYNYGFAAVKKEDKWGFIDSTGNELTDFKYEYVSRGMRDGTAFVRENGITKTIRVIKKNKL